MVQLRHASTLQRTFQWLWIGILHLSLTLYYLSFKHNLFFLMPISVSFCILISICFYPRATSICCVAACLRSWVQVPDLKVGIILVVAKQPAHHYFLTRFPSNNLTVVRASCWYLCTGTYSLSAIIGLYTGNFIEILTAYLQIFSIPGKLHILNY